MQQLEDEKRVEKKYVDRILHQHEQKVIEILEKQGNEKKKLHFAFFFASPLVLSCETSNESTYKLMPALDYNKEFDKILNSINQSKVQITLTKRQCRTDSLHEILAQKPLALHFSGHGLLNRVEDIGEDLCDEYKGQGDLLLLETEEGDSQLVSRDALKKMIEQNECDLQFVMVATCHSEFVGKILR